MSRRLLVLWCLLANLLAAASLNAQDQPDPRKWSIDPRMTGLSPSAETASIPQAIPNYVNPNMTHRVFSTPQGVYTVTPNFRVHPSSTVWQSEVPITRHPTDGNILYASSNAVRFSPTFISEGMYLTTDGGVTWFGSDTTNAAPIGNHGGDPAPAIGPDGRLYMSHLGFSTSGMFVTYSTNMGQTWNPSITIVSGSQDKNHTFVDNTPGSPYFGRAYVTWSLFTASAPPAVVSYSTNGGANWTAPITVLPVVAGHYAQGVNGAVGPNGVAYICWQSPVSASPFTGDFIGFAQSTDGGATWSGTGNAYDCNGIRGTLAPWNIRTNDFPSMGIDMTNSGRRGWIYIVTAEQNLAPAGSDPDIVLHRSTDGGTTWSPGIRVNQDALNNGKKQYMPWLTVDEAGGVNVIYYDNRNSSSGDSVEVFVSRSLDGGNTWTDIVVSDHKFRPAPISGLATGYQGDYIGITSANGKLFPYWADNSSGIYQAWTTILTTTENFGWAKGTITALTGGLPLNGVAVDIVENVPQVGGTTNSSGLYYAGARVDTPGTTRNVTLRARKFGYIDTTIAVTLTRFDTLTRNFAMRTAPGGTMLVHSYRNPGNVGVRSNVIVKFNGTTVVNDFTDSLTGNFTTPLPVGTYDVTVDAPHPYATRRFPAVVITAGATTNVDALLRAVVEYAPAEMRDTLLVGGTRNTNLALTNTTPDSVRFRISDDNTARALRMRVIVPEPAVQEKPIERPKGAPDTEFGDSPDGRGGPDAFGYQWIDSDEPGGPAFNWVDISTVGTQITTVTGGTLDDGYATVPMHFPFPIYGNSYTSINIGTNGFVNFGTGSSSVSNGSIPSTVAPNNAIYAFWDDLDFRTRGKLFYHRDTVNGRFIVQYDGVPRWNATSETDTLTFQIIMKPNGEITLNYGRMGSPTLNSSTIGVENAAGTVALQVVNNAAYMHDNLSVRIYLPDATWLSETPSFGTIPPNANLNIQVGFDAVGLTPGTTYNGKIVLDATHPDLTAPFTVPASLRVLPADSALLVLTKTSISFGTIALGTNRRDTTLLARNVGSQTLTISSITSNNARFVVDRSSATIAAGDSVRIRVTYTPALAQTDTGRIIMLSNSQGSPRKDVTLSGSAVGIPRIVAVPDSFAFSRPVGLDTTRTTFRIRNAGTDTLRYTINEALNSASDGSIERSITQQQAPVLAKGQSDPTPGQPASPTGRGGPDAFGYSWIDSDEPGGPTFNWVDISTTGTQITTWTGSADDGYATVPLPWEFPFYGANKTSVNVITNGFMSFSTTSTAFTNTAIPATPAPNDGVYPCWDDFDLRTSGQVFYQNDAANGRFIVQWHNVPHYALGTPTELDTLTFQVILRQNGEMLYQYLRKATAESTATVGIENSTGTIALQTSFNRRYVKPNLAVLITTDLLPWLSTDRTSGTIAPADSQAVELRVHPSGLNGGVYNGRLVITGNSSDTARVKVRLSLTGGTASLLVTSPNGGEVFNIGQTYPISWTQNLVDTVRIEYSTTGPAGPYTIITAGVPAGPSSWTHPKGLNRPFEGSVVENMLGTFNWLVPNVPSTNCYIRISRKSNGVPADTSNAAFTIRVQPATGDTSWVSQTSGTTSTLYSVKAVSNNVVWIAGTAGVVLRTTNGGSNWTSVGGGAIGTADVYAIEALDANTAFVTTTPGATFIYRTTNGGTSWTQVYTDATSGAFIDGIRMTSPTVGYAMGDPVGGKWVILRSSDGGATWARIATEPTVTGEGGWNNAFQMLGNTMWFGTNATKVYRSTDLGATWSSAATTSANSFGLHFNNASVGIAGFASGVINSSTNGGTSWAAATSAGTGQVAGAGGSSGSEYWVTGGTNVYYSSNQGASWTQTAKNGYTGATALWAIDMLAPVSGSTYGWAAGASGTILRYRRLPPTGVEGQDAIPTVYALDQNFPNPFNPTTTIRFALPEQATVSLKIYNLLGQEVVTLAQGDMSAAFHSVVWNGRNNSGSQVASGMYFYRIEATGVSGSTFHNLKKLILLK